MMFQNAGLFTDLNVFDNVAFPLRENFKLPEDLVRRMVLMKLHAVGLRGARDMMPNDLSGGMVRRGGGAGARRRHPQPGVVRQAPRCAGAPRAYTAHLHVNVRNR